VGEGVGRGDSPIASSKVVWVGFAGALR